MAEIITFLIALPLLYMIGGFYYRLAAWLCRTLGPATTAAATTGEQP